MIKREQVKTKGNEMKNIKVSASISRIQAHEGQYISIRITDDESLVLLCELKLTLEEFARLMFNESVSGINAVLGDTTKLGKVRESKTFEFKVCDCGGYYYSKDKAIKEGLKACPEGWEMSTYFGSQESIFTKDGDTWARTKIYRWI